MKKILTLALAVLMVLVLVPSAFAAQLPAADVSVPGEMGVRLTGSAADWENTKLTMTEADQEGTVDFTVSLDTSTICNTIKAWYEYGESLIDGLANGDPAREAYFAAKFDQWPVTGTFTVTITFPETFTVPAEYTANNHAMTGFNASASTLFEETERTLDGGKLTIKLKIKDVENDGIDGIMEQALYEGVTSDPLAYLDALTFTVNGVSTGKFTGTKTVKGKLDGYTSFKMGATDEADDDVHFYTAEQRVQLYRKAPGGTGGITTTPDEYTITFNVDGKTDEYDPMVVEKGYVKVTDLPDGKKQGYEFDGWYTDSAMTKKVGDKLYVSKDTVLYGHRKSATLDTEHHWAYVIGYPDETVRPDNNITREEVAMIFYRLLRDEVRDELRVTTNDFSDVADERWSNTAISTMANGKFVAGYPDGTFRPGANITRAEFATMATRFAQLYTENDTAFTDIGGHWAKAYIQKATTAGWIAGYPDNTFKPENPITRAEVMTIINRVLARCVNKEGLHEDTRLWIDMNENDWFYFIVLEATNSHTFVRQEDGINGDWIAIIENKTWD